MIRCLETPPLTTTTTRPRLPRGKRWTYADYCKIPPDRKRHEIIDGRHYVSPSPSRPHQWIAGQLFGQLNNRISLTGLGQVYHAPLDVHLGRLRKKLDRLGRPAIQTVRGEGYRLAVENLLD